MIYLFCNEGYGRSFIEGARAYKMIHPDLRVTLVFSSKTRVQGSAFLRDNRFVFGKLRTGIQRGVKTFKYRLPVLFARDINKPEFYAKISHRDTGIIAGFNQIFKAGTIKRFREMFNFHPSLLPFYRGPVPSYWCIHNHEHGGTGSKPAAP